MSRVDTLSEEATSNRMCFSIYNTVFRWMLEREGTFSFYTGTNIHWVILRGTLIEHVGVLSHKLYL